MATLQPNYLEIDFTTIITRIKEQLAKSDTFADYNYEGSNITILMELLAYIGELNVYFLNKIAKNIHIETADIYEAVNRNARQMGYEPKGPISSTGTVTVTVCGATIGHEYRVAEFTQLEAPEEEFEGETIKFATTTLYNIIPTAANFDFDVFVRQGEVVELTGYTGDDLIDNELILPSNYAYDGNVDDVYPSLELLVDGTEWSRVTDFFDELSPLAYDPNVYLFQYDRYERSKVAFSASRNVPAADQTISIKVLNTLAENGNVGANTITKVADQFLYDVTDGEWVDSDKITCTNLSATIGGAVAESITTIKENARAGLYAQFRNVAAIDYANHLEQRSDIYKATAWGEQEIYPSGSVNEFNRVHLSVIPTDFNNVTINTSAADWTTLWGETGTIEVPTAFNRDWRNTLKEYVEPRKMISAYEVFKKPDLVYFSFDWGVRKRRLANFATISTDLRNKLDYYFRAENQNFNSTINFNDIIEYLLDATEVSTDDNFDSLKDIRNLNLRDIDLSHFVYEPNSIGLFPQYVEPSATYIGDNQLRKISLGLDQFPVLQLDTVVVTEET